MEKIKEMVKEKIKDKKQKGFSEKKKEKQEEKVEKKPKKALTKWGKIILFGIVPICVILISLSIYYFVFFPHITLNGEEKVEVIYPDHYQEEGVTLHRLGKEMDASKVIKKGEVNEDKLGNYQITYSYQEFIFKKSVTRLVSIIDNEDPVLTLHGEKEHKVCPGKEYQEEGYEASDNFDGVITDKVVITKTEEGYVYEVKDSSNHVTTVTRSIFYVDDNLPTITLNGSSVQYVKVGTPYQEQGAKASDLCEGDITSKIEIKQEVDTSKAGTYEVVYQVTDASGNTTSMVRKVIVFQEGSLKGGVIYLTFDDGPHGANTTKILDVLKKYNVKATFFVTMGGPDSLIKREHDEGHTVALHTASHQYNLVYQSVDAYYQDLNQIHDRVQRITGVDSKIIRFPGGSSNTVSRRYSPGIMTALTKDVVAKGYRYYDWNISSGDAGNTTSSQVVYQTVVGNLRKDRANMVLMHDVKSYTAAAIEDIVKYGLANGYQFEKITYTTPMITQRVNN